MSKYLTLLLLSCGVILISGCGRKSSIDNSVINEKNTVSQEQTDNSSLQIETLKNENNKKIDATISKNIEKENKIDKLISNNGPTYKNKTICQKMSKFKNEIWAEKLNNLYQKQFLEPQSISNGNVWSVDAEGQDSCIIGNYFIFIPEYSEFGCMKIFKYDIKNNILEDTIFKDGLLCASRFGEITDSYIEYFGEVGDSGYGTKFHGRYYYLTNTQELIEKEGIQKE